MGGFSDSSMGTRNVVHGRSAVMRGVFLRSSLGKKIPHFLRHNFEEYRT